MKNIFLLQFFIYFILVIGAAQSFLDQKWTKLFGGQYDNSHDNQILKAPSSDLKNKDTEQKLLIKRDVSSESENSTDILKSYDYRGSDQFLISPVKNQLQCNVDWIFAALGALEAQWAKKTGKLVSLSAQHIIDCMEFYSTTPGCTFRPHTAFAVFKYLSKGNKVALESSSAPFSGIPSGNCSNDYSDSGIRLKVIVSELNPIKQAILEHVKFYGPGAIVVGVHKSFYTYNHGVYHCGSVNDPFVGWQSMLIVGFGSTKTNEEYLLLKNSWGTDWGEKGYIRMDFNSCTFLHLEFPILE